MSDDILTTLPIELFLLVVRQCNADDVRQLRSVCSYFRAVIPPICEVGTNNSRFCHERDGSIFVDVLHGKKHVVFRSSSTNVANDNQLGYYPLLIVDLNLGASPGLLQWLYSGSASIHVVTLRLRHMKRLANISVSFRERVDALEVLESISMCVSHLELIDWPDLSPFIARLSPSSLSIDWASCNILTHSHVWNSSVELLTISCASMRASPELRTMQREVLPNLCELENCREIRLKSDGVSSNTIHLPYSEFVMALLACAPVLKSLKNVKCSFELAEYLATHPTLEELEVHGFATADLLIDIYLRIPQLKSLILGPGMMLLSGYNAETRNEYVQKIEIHIAECATSITNLITNCPALQQLEIKECRITDEYMIALQALFPDVHIKWEQKSEKRCALS